MIQNKIKAISNKIPAKKCSIIEINSKAAFQFFEQNHLSGSVKNSKFNLALIYNDEIVSCISLRKPFIKKHHGKIEILRFATKLNTVCAGGFSRLLKQSIIWATEHKYSSIISYADKRFGTGKVYSLTGFDLAHNTDIDYFYTNGYKRFNRFSFRAQNNLSEKEIALNAGVHKVFGAGHSLYEKIL